MKIFKKIKTNITDDCGIRKVNNRYTYKMVKEVKVLLESRLLMLQSQMQLEVFKI
jgi:hypothetical protein